MFKTILVPVDWSALSEQAVLTAVNLSKILGGKLVLLSVAKTRLFHSTEPDAVRDGEEVEAANRALARESVAKASALAMEHGVPCETVISQSAILCDEIIDVAARYSCDAIFMATRGRMGILDTIFHESETQLVLRKTTIPVLVIPPDTRG
jgi:nucleotide-binding universal stress UspA family protein